MTRKFGNQERQVVVADCHEPAPLIFFDLAPASAIKDGIVGITLVAVKHIPVDGLIEQRYATVAHLRCSVESAMELRKAIDRALSASSQPVPVRN